MNTTAQAPTLRTAPPPARRHDATAPALPASTASTAVPAAPAPASVLVCRLCDQTHAVPLASVREIRTSEPLRRLVGAPPAVLGLFDLRGVVVPVLDMHRLTELPAPAPGAAGVVVIVEWGGRVAGLRFDAVSDVVDLPDHALRALPALGRDPHSPWTDAAQLGDELLLRLHVPALLARAGLGTTAR